MATGTRSAISWETPVVAMNGSKLNITFCYDYYCHCGRHEYLNREYIGNTPSGMASDTSRWMSSAPPSLRCPFQWATFNSFQHDLKNGRRCSGKTEIIIIVTRYTEHHYVLSYDWLLDNGGWVVGKEMKGCWQAHIQKGNVWLSRHWIHWEAWFLH